MNRKGMMRPYKRRYKTKKHPNPPERKIVRPTSTGVCIFCGGELGRCQRICCSSEKCRKERDNSYKGYYKHRTIASQQAGDEDSITTTHGQTYPVMCKCPNCESKYEKQLGYPQPYHKDGAMILQRIYCEHCDNRRYAEDGNTIYFVDIR